jgi:intracellular septation protein
MKLLFEFFPVVLFFIAYKFFDIYVATGVIIVATFLQVAVSWYSTRKVAAMQLATLAIIIVFGGLTLLLQNEQFIKWKPTVINWLFGAAFLASQFFGKRTVIERLMGGNLSLPKPVWLRLNLFWVLFFFCMGGTNLYVMSHFDIDTWVNFKLFGMLGLTVVFIMIQALYISRYMKESGGK